MPRGGYRPFSGGARPGAGRPRKGQSLRDIHAAARKAGQTPLEYMLAIMRDETADPHLRDQMAVAAAPYCHRKIGRFSGPERRIPPAVDPPLRRGVTLALAQ